MMVEEQAGVGVKTLEDQLYVRSREHFSRDVEGSPIFPIGLAYPLQLLFVVAIEGIVDQLVVEQVSMHAPGDACGVPLVFAGLAKLPPSVNGYCDPVHAALSSQYGLRLRGPGSQS